MATCSSCHAPIEWVKTAKGEKPIPLDIGEVEGGNIRVIDGRAHFPYGGGNRVSHFATCPNADRHRRR